MAWHRRIGAWRADVSDVLMLVLVGLLFLATAGLVWLCESVRPK